MTEVEANFWSKYLPYLASPASVALAVWFLKDKLKKIEKFSEVAIEFGYIKEKLIEIKADLSRLERQREDFVLLKGEVKTQWKKFDSLEKRLDNVGS